MKVIFDIITVGLFASTISLCAPLAISSLGGLISDKSGVPNIALEGIISAGAFCAVVFCIPFGPWLATLIAAIVGGLVALLIGLICVKGRGDIVIGGFAVNFICWGLFPVLSMRLYNAKGMTPRVNGFSPLSIPFVRDIPYLGSILERSTVLTYFGLIILPIIVFVLMYKTRFGKHIKATGLDPFSADTKGINVFRVRYEAIVLSGILAGVAGAELSQYC